jgi:hypothetical protein
MIRSYNGVVFGHAVVALFKCLPRTNCRTTLVFRQQHHLPGNVRMSAMGHVESDRRFGPPAGSI